MGIDLHTHSTASDGTQSPTEVVELAAATGLDVLGLTDHDSAAGWDEAAQAAVRVAITLIPGMELSTRHDGAAVHLLGYLCDPDYPPLRAELDKILAGRKGRLGEMLARLSDAGVDLDAAEVLRQAGEAEAIGRPHVADVLVAKGVVGSRDEAFARWLGWGRPGYVPRYATPTTDMVELVVAAGGAPVIAHPWGRGSRRVLDADAIAALGDHGLVGLEVYHQDHGPAERYALRGIAADRDLVVTGGSDYHGTGKVAHELGCNVTAPAELDRLLAAAADNARRAGRSVPQVVVG